MKKKTIALLLALALVFGGAVGGTFAWLTAKTDPVVNTFTTAGIDITLAESTGENYKMVPGGTSTKDPKATVNSGSEKCWLFVKIEEENNTLTSDSTKRYFTYDVASGWTLVPDETNVYYLKVDDTTYKINTAYSVLEDDKVTYTNDITQTDMTAAKTNMPKLKFTAYAVQLESFATAQAAWDVAKTL